MSHIGSNGGHGSNSHATPTNGSKAPATNGKAGVATNGTTTASTNGTTTAPTNGTHANGTHASTDGHGNGANGYHTEGVNGHGAGHRTTGLVLPAFRADLEIFPRARPGKPIEYFIGNGERQTVMQMGEAEFFICQELDGRTDAEGARARYEEEFRRPLPPEELDTFVQQLSHLGFLEAVPPRQRTLPEIFNPDELLPVARLGIARGGRALGWLARHMGWIYSRPALVAGAATVVLGLFFALFWFGDYSHAISEHWELPFILLGVVFSSIVVYSGRSIVQGLTCRRYAADVSEVGVTLMYYVLPWVFCDYRDVVWLRDKDRRLRVIASGIFYQLFVWGFATVAWWLTEPGLANTIWLSLSVVSGLNLLVLNGNPLVALDAYLLLMTWLEIPRLRERSLAVFGSWIARRPVPEPLTRREWKGMCLYGALACVYATAHAAFFLYAVGSTLTEHFLGAGALATLLIACWIFQRPIGRFLGRRHVVRVLLAQEGSTRKTWLWRVLVVAVLVILLLLPYPYETGGPFTILAQTRTEVNVEVEGGRVIRVFVKDGDLVQPGQVIGLLDPREYERNIQSTGASLDQAQSKLLLLRKEQTLLTNPPDIESIRVLEADVRRLKTMLADYQSQLELTKLKAPLAGRVTTPLIDQSVGKYLKKGDLFAAVEAPQAVQVEIQVPEADAPQVKHGARVKVVAWAFPYETFYGTVRDIAPIALQPAAGEKATAAKFVRVVAELPNPDLRLKAQLTGYAKIKADVIPVWQVISRLVGRWFAVQFWYWLP
jgi:multidrug resistance efflux pump